MTTINQKRRLAAGISAAAVAAALTFATPAFAQTTSTIRGDGGTPGATISATDTVTGRTVSTTVNADGTFVLAGLRPSTYRVVGAGQPQDITLPVGQTVTIDSRSRRLRHGDSGAIVVTGRRNRQEVRSATIGTSVSQTQIENLPQNDRNFLNFANLAPGVTVSTGANDKKIQAGGGQPRQRQHLHRRNQPQEPRRLQRHRRAELQPGQPVSAIGGPGVPGRDPELQGRV